MNRNKWVIYISLIEQYYSPGVKMLWSYTRNSQSKPFSVYNLQCLLCLLLFYVKIIIVMQHLQLNNLSFPCSPVEKKMKKNEKKEA